MRDVNEATFLISLPSVCQTEIEYVFAVVFGDWLGIPYVVQTHAEANIELSHDNNLLTLDTTFFQNAHTIWLHESTLPELPLKEIQLEKIPAEMYRRLKEGIPFQPEAIPVLYGSPKITIQNVVDGKSGTPPVSCHVHCGIDLLGSIFFMLSCYEEVVVNIRDQHDRFPATASIAYKAGFLNRPIVNEYLELLWAMMSYLWPRLQRKKREFRTLVSHDVDSPFEYAGLSFELLLRRVAGDVIRRKSIRQALHTFNMWNIVRRGCVVNDPHNTFDFIMTESEKRNLISAFYFIPDHSGGQIDGQYSLEDPTIIDLIQKIHVRKHEIGLHLSYNTYKDPVQTSYEAHKLKDTLKHLNILNEVKGGRQHFLRWNTPQTFRNWEEAGMVYDSTLSFADHAGFRCGTCYEYQVYDVVDRRTLELRERPLIAMDVTISGLRYMGLGYGDKAFDVLVSLKNTCRLYKGDFTLLWHNTEFVLENSRSLYLAVLDA